MGNITTGTTLWWCSWHAYILIAPATVAAVVLILVAIGMVVVLAVLVVVAARNKVSSFVGTGNERGTKGVEGGMLVQMRRDYCVHVCAVNSLRIMRTCLRL